MKWVLIGLGVLALLATAGMAVFVYVVQNVEQPRYASVRKEDPFELRDYPPLVVAEVRRDGSRREALSDGFGPLARYIFAKERGADSRGERIAMTAPVVQQSGAALGSGQPVAPDERIAMTAPVLQMPAEARAQSGPSSGSSSAGLAGSTGPSGTDADRAWSVGFIMPSQYSLSELPAPAGDVRLTELPARLVAAVRFSGTWGEERVAAQERALREWMAKNDLQPAAPPIYAYYNDPFTPPFLRRNEVMIEVARSATGGDLPRAGEAAGGASETVSGRAGT